MNYDELTFDHDDKLGRGKYADFIVNLVRRGQGSEGRSYTLAIDASYGSGKTMFLHMLKNKIIDKYSTMNVDKPLIVAYYNAWQYDFFGEALEPLVLSIMECEELAVQKDGQEGAKKFRGAMAVVGAAANAIIQHKTGISLDSFIDSCKNKAPSDDKQEVEFNTYEEKIRKLSDALTEAAKVYDDHARLLVIIDELDRCRPDFALKTLEITKHILDSNNVVFLYAVDMRQLQKTVEKMYGSGMDSAGYLLRFFDYISVMPKASNTEYLANVLMQSEVFSRNEFLSQPKIETELQKSFGEILDRIPLTPRDIDRIINAYVVMVDMFLGDYDNIIAYTLYFHLVCLKYKMRDVFDAIFGLGEITEKTKNYIDLSKSRRRNVEADPLCLDHLIYLYQNCSKKLYMPADSGVVEGRYLGVSTPINATRIFIESTDSGIKVTLDDDTTRIGSGRVINVDKSFILNRVIFYADIKNMDYQKAEIITLREYIHQKLEMFDFSMRDDEAQQE